VILFVGRRWWSDPGGPFTAPDPDMDCDRCSIAAQQRGSP
jgi:hypothetical protein